MTQYCENCRFFYQIGESEKEKANVNAFRHKSYGMM